jgi:uncharacterized protein YjiK
MLPVSAAFLFLIVSRPCHAALVVLDSFNGGTGQISGLGFDRSTDTVWIYGSSDADLRQFTRTGTSLTSIARPGESANDFDVEFAPENLSLNGTAVPKQTLIAINGETGAAEIYAVNKLTGAVIATLNTTFGLSHVVGGAYHRQRDTFFLVQDRQPAGSANDSVVAEIDPDTGGILSTFKIDNILAGYTVNFGDLDINRQTGNLFIVSSDETSIAELTPAGTFVQTHALPVGVSSLSGLGLDESRGELWVSGTGGTVWRLGGLPAVPEPNALGLIVIAALLAAVVRRI